MAGFKAKRLDISQLLDIFIILGFALFFIRIINNDKVLMYVHPRIVPYLRFAVFFLLAVCPFMLRDIMKRTVRGRGSAQYVIIGVTLLLAFLVPPATLNAANAGSKLNMNLNSASVRTQGTSEVSKAAANSANISKKETGQANTKTTETGQTGENITKAPQTEPKAKPAAQPQNGNTTAAPTGTEGSSAKTPGKSNAAAEAEKQDKSQEQDVLEVNDDNYVELTYDTFENLDNYIGRQVRVSGFVYKDNKMQKDEFIIGKYCMSCCTADLALLGFLNKYEQSGQIKENGWYSVEGTIVKGTYDGEAVPEIEIQEIHQIPKPADEYVYP